MVKTNHPKTIFSGHRRIFFLVAALAAFMQVCVFFQDRADMSLSLIKSDFKIAVTLNNVSSAEANDFKKILSALPGVEEVTGVNVNNILERLKRGNTMSSQAVNPDFLPYFFEVRVNQTVILNPHAWVNNNIGSMPQDAAAYYKEDQANLAIYINALNMFINIMIACAILLLLIFAFFVEAYYTEQMPFKKRIAGTLSALFATGIIYGVTAILVMPINSINYALKYNLFSWPQAGIFIATGLMGWSLTKWKRF